MKQLYDFKTLKRLVFAIPKKEKKRCEWLEEENI